jgi:hypothetical protein
MNQLHRLSAGIALAACLATLPFMRTFAEEEGKKNEKERRTQLPVNGDNNKLRGFGLTFAETEFELFLTGPDLVEEGVEWEKKLDCPKFPPRKAMEVAIEYAKKTFIPLEWEVEEVAILRHGRKWYYRVDLELNTGGLQPKVQVYLRLDGTVIPWKRVK